MKNTIVIVKGNRGESERLASFISREGPFEVLAIAENGSEGLKAVEGLKPDFLITELILSGIDGFCLIEKTKNLSPETKVVVVSAFSSEDVIERAIEKGASYFMVKPIDNSLLCERLIELCGESVKREVIKEREVPKRSNLEEKISKLFLNVGIPPHIKGYSYLREGVKMAVADPDIINSITKKLYPMIGEKYSTSASKVERAIRHAIEVAWNRGRIDTINNILGVRAFVGTEKPTNGEFIALIADKMLLERA